MVILCRMKDDCAIKESEDLLSQLIVPSDQLMNIFNEYEKMLFSMDENQFSCFHSLSNEMRLCQRSFNEICLLKKDSQSKEFQADCLQVNISFFFLKIKYRSLSLE